ncbi:hypothetical protein AJ79_05084 [Helicocarpus griseus UAMH5409]|uniref:Endo-1,4-beta-xylanase n=1 Tax=Helicocarpus griseus UAMH5409 TaxID=1447875 RepID=A0A2B7XQX3_9EURO|nr:hypothetical protein AJ79_05084 [Helicocarpus griseus UAMH5409]
MLSFILLSAISLIQGVSSSSELAPRQGNYFYSYWSEGNGRFNCPNGPGGQFSADWSGNGGFVCGKGWNPGGNRVINFSGTYEPQGAGYLAVYGWMQNPLIEYYVLQSYGELAPNEPWTYKGNFTSEEGTYDLYWSQRVNKPSIEGTRTFDQYWSVRTEKVVGGPVTTARHFEEWQKAGMRMGANHNYMIVAVEGYTMADGTTSSGRADITVQ